LTGDGAVERSVPPAGAAAERGTLVKRVGRKISGAYALVTFRDAGQKLGVEVRCPYTQLVLTGGGDGGCTCTRPGDQLRVRLQVFFEQTRTAHTMFVAVPEDTAVRFYGRMCTRV
jgi:hypothetical protein